MIKVLHRPSRIFILLFIALFFSVRSYATHIFGGDLYYTWVSGNTYTITLVIYGDCSGASFPTFPSSIPTIDIYNGATLSSSVNLSFVGPSTGVEVTPVCPAYKDSTACNHGTVPGIKKFVWAKNVTLPDTSSQWVFVFAGALSASSAGRSGSITNISGGSTTTLVDTLNNTYGPVSSAQFTTIPTPFFCDNQKANFNPGAVPATGDNLTIGLVPGLDGSASSNVTYSSGFSAIHPLAVSDTMTLDPITGQLTFTPNQIQKALVVMQVNEYNSSGQFVGTSMREMTFVVINCNNSPASGAVTKTNGAIKVDSTNVQVCSSQGVFAFNVDPTDADGANITVTSAGLPAGSTFTVVDDKTPNPIGTFTWDASKTPIGKYTFFLTFKGDECPLASTQTQAYTINIIAGPSINVSQINLGSCSTKGIFQVIGTHPWTARIFQGTKFVLADTSIVSDTLIDSLPVGSYRIYLTNKNNCVTDTPFDIASYPPVVVTNVATTPATCYGYKTGSMTISAAGGYGQFIYTIDSLAPLDSNKFFPMKRPTVLDGNFDSLYSGIYKVIVNDAHKCLTDTIVTVSQPDSLGLFITSTPNKCIGLDTVGGASVLVRGGNPPYQYRWNTNVDVDSFISNKPNGNYEVYVSDINNCNDSAKVSIDYDDCCTPFIPSGFTPNGDGKNDVFRIRFKGDIKLHDFSIYNRYGEKVFYTIYPQHGWDGTFGGVPQDVGTYFYIVKFDCGNKGDHAMTLSGDLTLIR